MIAEKSLTTEESDLVEQYYRAHYELLFKYALRILHDQSLAEVAVQETFLVASRRVDKLKESEKPIGWLFNVLKYTIKSMKRDRATVLEHCVSLEDAEISTENDLIPEELSEAVPDMDLLRRFYVEGYKLCELAKEESTTVAALKMRLYRARQRLRNDPWIKKLKEFD